MIRMCAHLSANTTNHHAVCQMVRVSSNRISTGRSTIFSHFFELAYWWTPYMYSDFLFHYTHSLFLHISFSGEKLSVLNALINQLLTYVACRDFVEDNFDKLRQARNDLKQLQWAEQRRERDETTFWCVLSEY